MAGVPQPGSVDEQALLGRVGACLRSQREALGLSRRQVAERAGISERFLSQVEAGQGNIAVTRLARLAAVLDVTPAEILACATSAKLLPVVALVGLRGAGKSSLGGAVAKRLGVPFFEHDRLVEEQAGVGVGEIFELRGESWYREVGRRALEEHLLAGTGPEILATSGGIVTDQAAYDFLLQRCHTIWLKADAEEHWERVAAQGDRRPMRDHSDAKGVLRRLLADRQPLYAAAAWHFDTSGLPFGSAVDQLADTVQGILRDQEAGPQRRR